MFIEVWKRHALLLAAALAAALLLSAYLTLAPQRLTRAHDGADGGDLLAAQLSGGVPHPSGYPTYLLLGQLFQALPWGTPVWRAVLYSASAAALAALLVGLLAAWVRPAAAAVWAGTLAAGLSPLLWSQAVIVEVYGLYALFLALALWWLAALDPAGGRLHRPGVWVWLALAFGLGLGVHLTLVLVVPALALAWVRARRAGTGWGALAAQAAALALGAAVYLTLPLRAVYQPPVNWGAVVDAQRLGWLVSGRLYWGLLRWDAADWPQRLAEAGQVLLAQFGAPGLALAGVGLVVVWRRRCWLGGALVWLALAGSAFFVLYRAQGGQVYLLVVVLAMAVWIGAAAGWLWAQRWRAVRWGALLLAAWLAYALSAAATNWPRIDPRPGTDLALTTEAYLLAAPPGALLLAEADADTFGLWYYHFGLGWRPDVRVVCLPLAGFDWYQSTLRHTYPDLHAGDVLDGQGERWLADLLDANRQRPVCRSQPDAAAPGGFSWSCAYAIAP